MAQNCGECKCNHKVRRKRGKAQPKIFCKKKIQSNWHLKVGVIGWSWQFARRVTPLTSLMWRGVEALNSIPPPTCCNQQDGGESQRH